MVAAVPLLYSSGSDYTPDHESGGSGLTSVTGSGHIPDYGVYSGSGSGSGLTSGSSGLTSNGHTPDHGSGGILLPILPPVDLHLAGYELTTCSFEDTNSGLQGSSQIVLASLNIPTHSSIWTG